MESWLAKLLAQLHSSMPVKPKDDYPDITITWDWVEKLVSIALTMVDSELQMDGSIGYRTARQVHMALVAALVTGCYCPPPRIHVLLSLIHPRFVGRISCQDLDCLNGEGCKGNHLELLNIVDSSTGTEEWSHHQYKTSGASFRVVHSKNDRYVYEWTIIIITSLCFSIACLTIKFKCIIVAQAGRQCI